jgi:hypothetical protein
MARSKPWAREVRGRKPTGSRERRRVLIVCEDSKSSRDYFDSFPIDKQRIEIRVDGTGRNTDSLIDYAVGEIERAEKNGRRYSEAWCVFDRDDFPHANYARAFQLAANRKIKVAWANEAFELWYLLHYCYLDAAIGRTDYARKLREFGLEYDKADKKIYEKIKDRQQTAMKNAAMLEKHWNDLGKRPAECGNPSTGVS